MDIRNQARQQHSGRGVVRRAARHIERRGAHGSRFGLLFWRKDQFAAARAIGPGHRSATEMLSRWPPTPLAAARTPSFVSASSWPHSPALSRAQRRALRRSRRTYPAPRWRTTPASAVGCSDFFAFVEHVKACRHCRRLAAGARASPAQETGGTVWRCQPFVKTSDRVRLEFLTRANMRDSRHINSATTSTRQRTKQRTSWSSPVMLTALVR